MARRDPPTVSNFSMMATDRRKTVSRFWRAGLVACGLGSMALADTLEVGPGETFATIQAAIDAAQPGDVIEVAPGIYPESLWVDVAPLILRGARWQDDARGRVAGVPDAALESRVEPAAGPAIRLATAAGGLIVEGFSLRAPVAGGEGVVASAAALSPGLVLRHNHVAVTGAGAGAAMRFDHAAEDATIEKNDLVAGGGGGEAIRLAAGVSFDGWHVIDNVLRRPAPVAGTGLRVAGDGNLGPSGVRDVRIAGNRVVGHALGMDFGPRSLVEAEVSGNEFDGNGGGVSGGPWRCRFEGNLWSGNADFGLRLTDDGPDGAGRGARENEIVDNEFSGNGGGPGGLADLVVDDQAAGHVAGQLVRFNRFLSVVGVRQDDPDETLEASFNYWNDPGGAALGAAALGPVVVTPWFRDAALSELDFGGVAWDGSVELGDGVGVVGDGLELAPGAELVLGSEGRIEVDELVLGAGAAVGVEQGRIVVGHLDLQPGATLEVIRGELVLDPPGAAGPHQIAGSFRFLHCLGSLEILADTIFSGNSFGLSSDIHVADGVTLTVTGVLEFDGCRLDSPGTFDLLVNPGAVFTLRRCEVDDAAVFLAGGNIEIRDCRFRDSDVTVFGSVVGARIFHNVFEDGPGSLVLLPSAGVVETEEGWGNVSPPALPWRQLRLGFEPPADPTRTLDAEGRLYVQPGDALAARLEVAALDQPMQAVEAVLGFDSVMLTPTAPVPAGQWENELFGEVDATMSVGRLNTAIGLGFSVAPPEGTVDDGPVALLPATAGLIEGSSRVFFREPGPDDPALLATRLTAGNSGLPSHLEFPFTENTPDLVIDGTDPEFGPDFEATQEQDAVTVDALAMGVVTRQGVLRVRVDARDELRGSIRSTWR